MGIVVEGVLVLANPPAERVLGTGRRGELLGRSILDLVHPDDRPVVRALIARVLDSGGPVPWAAVRMLDASGEPVEQEISALRIEFSGTPALMLVGRDIHTIRRAEEALLESEHRYHALAARAPVAIYRLDTEGKCIYLNERWSQLLGIPVEEALGRSWIELVSGDGKKLASEVWRRIVAGPGEY
ncbi:MAG: PAS domain-containing protein, partial [Solirubrobacteraceae bacterium]